MTKETYNVRKVEYQVPLAEGPCPECGHETGLYNLAEWLVWHAYPDRDPPDAGECPAWAERQVPVREFISKAMARFRADLDEEAS